jgi:hypothetical protein
VRTLAAGGESFTQAAARVREARIRPEFRVDEAPAPQRLAPFALALTVESAIDDRDPVSGRFVLLHDPDGVDEWEGDFRAVVFARAALEPDLVADPMLHEVGWSWLIESLADNAAHAAQIGGTVTVTAGQSFGSLSDRPRDGFVEIRASWTPVSIGATPVHDVMERHVEAWIELLRHATGLMPMAPGVQHVQQSQIHPSPVHS